PNTPLSFTASVSPCRTLSVLLGSTPFQKRMTYPSSSYFEGLIRTMRNFLNRGCGVGSVFDVCSLVSGLNIFFLPSWNMHQCTAGCALISADLITSYLLSTTPY